MIKFTVNGLNTLHLSPYFSNVFHRPDFQKSADAVYTYPTRIMNCCFLNSLCIPDFSWPSFQGFAQCQTQWRLPNGHHGMALQQYQETLSPSLLKPFFFFLAPWHRISWFHSLCLATPLSHSPCSSLPCLLPGFEHSLCISLYILSLNSLVDFHGLKYYTYVYLLDSKYKVCTVL